MVSWVLVPSLVILRSEFNKIAPLRSKASDGTIGDSAHAKVSSDHNPDETGKTPHKDADNINEVHALDITKDLNSKEFDMEDCIQYILSECRKSGTSGKDKGRLKNIIYNKRIWSATWGWGQRNYTGDNPHIKHAHFSAEYDSKFSEDTSPWGLVDRFGDDMGTVDRISPAAIKQIVTAATIGVLSYGAIGPDGKEEKGVTDLPGHKASNVLNLIDATYNHVKDLNEMISALNEMISDLNDLVETQGTAIEDLLAKVNYLLENKDNK